MPTATIAAPTKPSSAKSIWQAVKRAAKEHHESVNAAYSTYYGMGTADLTNKSRQSSAASSRATSPRTSTSEHHHHHHKKHHAQPHHDTVSENLWGFYGASNSK